MRIVSWNCNLKLSSKFDKIADLKPDILIVQECEELPSNFFTNAQYHWIGNNDKKGLGVLLFNQQGNIDTSYNDKLACFLPINLDDGMRILATWAYNHRAAERFGDEYKGNPIDALEHYQNWLGEAERAVVIGDFNNSVVWDKNNKTTNFSAINSSLNHSGFNSVWHSQVDESFGNESMPTLFHTKNQSKPYHIDYCYLKGLKSNNIAIGHFNDWITYSDHMPLVVDVTE